MGNNIRLQTLMGSGKSGVVALLDNGTVIVWIEPLRTIFANNEWEDSYMENPSVISAGRFVSGYIEQSDEIPLSELPVSEQECVAECLRRLLWDMAHDDDCADNESDEYWNWDIDQNCFESGSLTGAETLEQDIADFFQFLDSDREFSIGDKRFNVYSSDDDECGTAYVLSEILPDTFTDEDTGENFEITRCAPVFRASTPGILYAKCRAYRSLIVRERSAGACEGGF